ncbi:MAG: tetratricopeptide repeat protein [Planctomycetota bacterium]|nr:tetratricopeptide repeat protein [Planctomycetota bacterium]
MNRNLIRLAVCVLIGFVALGQVKVVTLKNGQKIKGEVTKTANGYQVRTQSGAVVTFTSEQVLSVADVVTPEQEYKQRLERINPQNAEHRYVLARWAFRQGLLQEARLQLRAALKINADYEQASLLLRQVNARIEQQQSEKSRPTEGAGPGPSKPRDKPITGLKPEWLVSQEDLYRIRLEEMDRSSNRPEQVVIELRNDVINRFVRSMRGRQEFKEPQAEEKFKGLPRVRQVSYILDKVDPYNIAIKDDIIIKSDPRFMVAFRSRVWPIVARHCATAHCHGGDKPKGGLKLFNIPGKNPKVDYTNFLILDMFATSGKKMLNRDHRELSLLLQYGLPPEQSQFDHPEKITPPFRDRKSQNYRRVLEWINSLSGPLHPDYRTTYIM